MRILRRYLGLCALPLVLGAGGAVAFRRVQGSCIAMVGPLLAAACRTRQRDYLHRVEFGAAGLGAAVAVAVGAWLEHRRHVTVVEPNRESEAL